jgi:stearoyl-CoA desaturase (delta-9 desaturase)
MESEKMFAPTPFKILFVQLLAWIGIPVLLWYGSWVHIIGAVLMYTLYGGAGVSLTFHRILSHAAFKLNPVLRKIMITIASFANVGSPITWVAVHRAHHRFVDTERDPHSPHHMPFWYMMFGTMYSQVSVKFTVDLLRDPFCRFIHKYYFAVQLPWIVLLFLLGGWKAVLAFHLVPGGMTWLGGSLVNYLNHLHGYKPFDGQGTSTNNLITGFLVFGEGWHNMHHAKPTTPTTKLNWWEFDLVYQIGRLIGTPRGKR